MTDPDGWRRIHDGLAVGAFSGRCETRSLFRSTTPRTSKLALSANMSRKFKLLSQRLTGLPSLETSYQTSVRPFHRDRSAGL